MPLFRSLAIILLFGFTSSAATAQLNVQGVTIIEAPSNFEFVDMGYDPVTDEVGIVGSVINGTERTATVFELNTDRDGFTTQTLANLPGATQNATVNGISSDAYRIAGSSTSTASVDFEGVTWLRSSPSSSIGIGFIESQPNRSSTIGAWRDGVVGEAVGSTMPITWNQSDGIQVLPGTDTSTAIALDVSSNAEIVIGFSGHEILNGAAYYWDNSGIHRLNDNIQNFTLIQSRANSISPNGNYIGGEIVAIDALGSAKAFPVVWEGTERTLRILTDSNGDFIQGTVNDVSDSGYAAGSFFDASFNAFGFIWNPEFTNGIRLFEDWLEEESPGVNFSFDSINVDSIASGNGKLFFTVLSNIGEFALVEMVFDVELGDVNQDGDVNFLDISPFISVLSTGDFQAEADVDRSGGVNFLDIAPFIQVLSSN